MVAVLHFSLRGGDVRIRLHRLEPSSEGVLANEQSDSVCAHTDTDTDDHTDADADFGAGSTSGCQSRQQPVDERRGAAVASSTDGYTDACSHIDSDPNADIRAGRVHWDVDRGKRHADDRRF